MVLHSGVDYTERQSQSYPYIDPLKLDLNGKSVFITGASKGIGSALAIGYARAGASIIGLAARSTQVDLAKAVLSAAIHAKRPEPKVFTYAMDVTERGQVEEVAKQFAKDAEGKLDIIVNNAGYLSSFAPIIDSDPDDWWKNWEVNVKGIYLVSRSFLPIMLKDNDSLKTVVNLTSAGAHNVSNGGSGYQTTKLAVCRLTEFIGVEYGDQGVLAYGVHPGAVPTAMGTKFSSTSGVAMVDDPEVCGDTLPFLTAEKRDWLQGRYLSCTWDMEEVMKRKDNIVDNDYLKHRMRIG